MQADSNFYKKIKLSMNVHTHLMFVEYQYNLERAEKLDDLIYNLECFKSFKQYCEKQNFTNIVLNQKDKKISANRPLTEREKQVAEVYKYHWYLLEYNRQIENVKTTEKRILAEFDEVEKNIERLNQDPTLLEISHLENKILELSQVANENLKLGSFIARSFKKIKIDNELLACRERIFFLKKKANPIIVQIDEETKEIEKLKRTYQELMKKETAIKSYKKDYIFTNIQDNDIQNPTAYSPGVGYWLKDVRHQHDSSLTAVLSSFNKGQKECAKFLLDNNLQETDEVKKILGLI